MEFTEFIGYYYATAFFLILILCFITLFRCIIINSLLIALAFTGIVIIIEMNFFLLILKFTEYASNVNITVFLKSLLPEDIFFIYILFWLLCIFVITYLFYLILFHLYRYLIKKTDNIHSKKVIIYAIPILKWTNFIAFIFTTYLILISIYSSVDFTDINSISIDIITLTLIVSTFTYTNNYYLNKIVKEQERERINSMLEKKIEKKFEDSFITVKVIHKHSESIWRTINKFLKKINDRK